MIGSPWRPRLSKSGFLSCNSCHNLATGGADNMPSSIGHKWQLGPAQMEDRGYHSTAVLLPDGRIFSGGDNAHPLQPDGRWSLDDTAEIYSPPYLFKGRRPAIKRAPKSVGWKQTIKIKTKRGKAARKAVLMAPGATTHGADMNQRLVELRLKALHGRKGIDVVSPRNARVTSPGYYMLFVLSRNGVPSVAKWIHLG